MPGREGGFGASKNGLKHPDESTAAERRNLWAKFFCFDSERAGSGGELQEIRPRQGAQDGRRRDGTVPPLNRTQAAEEAGLSDDQRKTALRVASIPEDEFEAAVESADCD